MLIESLSSNNLMFDLPDILYILSLFKLAGALCPTCLFFLPPNSAFSFWITSDPIFETHAK